MVVTGGIGSGKSTVCAIFKDLGANTVSADELAREASDIAKPEIISHFPQCFDKEGNLNRRQLAEFVFKDSTLRLKLEAILHPIIQKLADDKFSKAIKDNAPLVIYECPLFFETNMNKKDYRCVIVVDVPVDLAIERSALRDNLDRESIKQRMSAQKSREERNADYIIDNSGNLENLKKEVTKLFNKLKSPT